MNAKYLNKIIQPKKSDKYISLERAKEMKLSNPMTLKQILSDLKDPDSWTLEDHANENDYDDYEEYNPAQEFAEPNPLNMEDLFVMEEWNDHHYYLHEARIFKNGNIRIRDYDIIQIYHYNI